MKTFLALALALGLTACGLPPGAKSYGTDPPEGKVDPDAPERTCAEWAQDALAVRKSYCARCHGDGARRGGFGDILDKERLISAGKIVPGDPDASLIYKRSNEGSMPPAGEEPRPSADDVEALRQWILCLAADPDPDEEPGEERAFRGLVRDVLIAMQADVSAIPRAEDRRNARYFTSRHVPGDVEAYSESASYLANSLSQAGVIAVPHEAGRQIHRIDLREYGWDADTWARMLADYPFGVRYDALLADSERYDAALVDAYGSLVAETADDQPWIMADWFLGNASRAPLYYDVLGIPATLDELTADLGIDLAADVDNNVVMRAGFNTSGVSLHNRVIERHDLFGNGGYFWITADFQNSVGARNVFADPLRFEPDGGEGIFSLPNGLQAYFIIDAAGNVLDKAAQAIVQDPRRPAAAVETAVSCMGCHHGDGIIAKDDQIREYVLVNFAPGTDRDKSLLIYPPREEMRAQMLADSKVFVAARRQTGMADARIEPVLNLTLEYEQPLNAERAANQLGLSRAELLAILNADPSGFPQEVRALRAEGGTIQRDAYDEVYPVLVCLLALGEPLEADCVTVLGE